MQYSWIYYSANSIYISSLHLLSIFTVLILIIFGRFDLRIRILVDTWSRPNRKSKQSLEKRKMVLGCELAMPIIVLNMGGEMIYILHQRLQAQQVPEEKSRKVLEGFVAILLA